MSGVDVIVDLDMSLPFRSDSVDLLVMNHSLEHVSDLLGTLKEVYRICRHGAQVCVVAPYFHQALNLANPFHRQPFNEHTPRFWTDCQHTLVEPLEFSHPHAPGWGLSRSDHGDPGIDFRCVSMEFFYFPEYRNLPPDQQRAARKKYLDVCDQIMYQLIVVKGNLSEAEMWQVAQGTPPFEPLPVTLRKHHERIEAFETQLRQTRTDVEFERAAAAKVSDELTATVARLDEANVELAEMRQLLATAREQATATQQGLERATEELAEARSRLAQAREETRLWEGRAGDAHAQIAGASNRLEEAERGLALWQRHARAMSTELAAPRRRRGLRIVERFRPGSDLSQQISPPFQDLVDDSYLFLGNLRGFRLQPSEYLQTRRPLAYAMRLDRPNLSGLMLAPIIDFPDESGSLVIELATLNDLTVASARVSLSAIEHDRPVRFVFPSVPPSVRSIVLKVDIYDTTTPVRLFEWRKRRFVGLGRLATQPFCAFIFGQRGA